MVASIRSWLDLRSHGSVCGQHYRSGGTEYHRVQVFGSTGAALMAEWQEQSSAAAKRLVDDCPQGCGAMYTASTMASSFEAMGMALPGSSSHQAERSGHFHPARESFMMQRSRTAKILSPRHST